MFSVSGLESDRLLFREANMDDYFSWLPFFRNFDAYKYLGFHEIPTAEERCNVWFERILYRYQNKEGGLNALIKKDNNVFIGFCGIHKQIVDDIEEIEIGYSLLPEYWGKGFATEAANKCREYAEEKMLAKSIISIVYVENYSSEKVALKNKMHFDKQTNFKGFPVNVYRYTF